MPQPTTNFLHKLLNELPEESKWILTEGLPYMPQARIYQMILQLEQDVLKKVLVKKGADSEEYKFFMNIKNILYQAGEAVHLIETLHNELLGFKQYNEFLQARNNKLEQEVNRFRTIEELSATGVLEAYINRTREVLKQESETKKNTH